MLLQIGTFLSTSNNLGIFREREEFWAYRAKVKRVDGVEYK
jgi:hypothetical protein